ncbi:MAG: hypothetical protein J7498_06150 [Sphingobium sp.]|nr:hypothetical protein [Sphingobium sp.]
MVAVLSASLVGAAGFALDAATYYAGNRNLRAATEAAALTAAMDPANGASRAKAYLVRNGFDPSVFKSIEIGRYCPNVHLQPAQRFDTSYAMCAGNGQSNAVRIKTSAPSRQYLSRILGPANPIPQLAATATAARIDEAGIGTTSGIVTVTNSLVNSVNGLLGALLNVHLTLSTANIEALVNGNVDAGLFFDALARRVGESGTYGDLVARSVELNDLMNAAGDAAPNATTATTLRLLAIQVGTGHRVPLSGLFGLGLFKDMPVGEADTKPTLRAGLNAYQLWAYAVQSGSGTIDLSNAVSMLVSGSTVKITGIARGPLNRPRFSFGPAGETSTSTGALRLQLQIGMGNISVLGNPVPVQSVPVLIDIAAAQAELTAIDCAATAEQARDTRVTIHGSSGLANAYIGTAPANAMTSPMPAISASDIGQARIVNALGLVTVDARATAGPVMGNSANVVFGPGGPGTVGSPSQPGTPVSIGNGSQVGPLLSTLSSSIAATNGVQVNILGLCLPVVCDSTASAVRAQLVNGIVTPLAGLVGSTVDPLLDNILAALGIQLGHATLWATGARCGVPVLV